MLQFIRDEKRDPATTWHKVRVKDSNSGFLYADRTGKLERAGPGQIVEIDAGTLSAVRQKVTIV
jgi:hypothetical protein